MMSKSDREGLIGKSFDAEGALSEKTINQKLTLLRMLGDWRDSAANRYWTRFHMFLMVNSLIGAGLLLSPKPLFELVPLSHGGIKYPIGALVLSLAGLAFSWIWLEILRAAKYYEHCWYSSMRALLKESPYLSRVVHLYELKPGETNSIVEPSDQVVRAKRLSTQYAALVVKVFIVMWASLAIVVLQKFYILLAS